LRRSGKRAFWPGGVRDFRGRPNPRHRLGLSRAFRERVDVVRYREIEQARIKLRRVLGTVRRRPMHRLYQGISYTVVSSATPRSAACCIVGCRPALSRIFAVFASSITGLVTKMAREEARPCTRAARFTVWPK